MILTKETHPEVFEFIESQWWMWEISIERDEEHRRWSSYYISHIIELKYPKDSSLDWFYQTDTITDDYDYWTTEEFTTLTPVEKVEVINYKREKIK